MKSLSCHIRQYALECASEVVRGNVLACFAPFSTVIFIGSSNDMVSMCDLVKESLIVPMFAISIPWFNVVSVTELCCTGSKSLLKLANSRRIRDSLHRTIDCFTAKTLTCRITFCSLLALFVQFPSSAAYCSPQNFIHMRQQSYCSVVANVVLFALFRNQRCSESIPFCRCQFYVMHQHDVTNTCSR